MRSLRAWLLPIIVAACGPAPDSRPVGGGGPPGEGEAEAESEGAACWDTEDSNTSRMLEASRRFDPLPGECSGSVVPPVACDWSSEVWACWDSFPTGPCNPLPNDAVIQPAGTCAACAAGTAPCALTVCAGGTCSCTTITAALAAVPSNLTSAGANRPYYIALQTTASYAGFTLSGKTTDEVNKITIQAYCDPSTITRVVPTISSQVIIDGVKFTTLEGINYSLGGNNSMKIRNDADYTTIRDSLISVTGMAPGLVVRDSDHVRTLHATFPSNGKCAMLVTCNDCPQDDCGICRACTATHPTASDYFSAYDTSVCGNNDAGIRVYGGRGHEIRGSTVSRNNADGVTFVKALNVDVNTTLLGHNTTASRRAIFIDDTPNATVRNSHLFRNRAGMAFVNDSDNCVAWNNLIWNNSPGDADDNSFGIGLFNITAGSFGSNVDRVPNNCTIRFNTIYGNAYGIAGRNRVSVTGPGPSATVSDNVIVNSTRSGIARGCTGAIGVLNGTFERNLYENNADGADCVMGCAANCVPATSDCPGTLACPAGALITTVPGAEFTDGPRGCGCTGYDDCTDPFCSGPTSTKDCDQCWSDTDGDGQTCFNNDDTANPTLDPCTCGHCFYQDQATSVAINNSDTESDATCNLFCMQYRTTDQNQALDYGDGTAAACPSGLGGDADCADLGYHYPVCVRRETCPSGTNDCDDNIATGPGGCEEVTITDPDNCGGCGAALVPVPDPSYICGGLACSGTGMGACPAVNLDGRACTLGDCDFTCSTNYADCDRDVTNGCEAPVTGALAGASCGFCYDDCEYGATCSATGTCTGGCPRQLLRRTSFDEAGAGQTNPWTEAGTGGPIIKDTQTIPAHEGFYVAALCENVATGCSQNVSQTVTLPATLGGTNPMALEFWFQILTADEQFTSWDYLYVEVKNGAGAWTELTRLSNQDSTSDWLPVRLTIPSTMYSAGATFGVRFRATSDGSGYTKFYVDDVKLYTFDGCSPDPASAWVPLPSSLAPSARRGHVAVWATNCTADTTDCPSSVAGPCMIVQGGRTATSTFVSDMRRWYPTSGAGCWSDLAPGGTAPAAGAYASAVYTGAGGEMIVWGGCNGASCGTRLNTGGIYNPATHSWRTATSTTGPPTARYLHSAVMSAPGIDCDSGAAGTQPCMIVWGGNVSGGDNETNTGSRFLYSATTSGSWAATSTVVNPSLGCTGGVNDCEAYSHDGVWADNASTDVMFVNGVNFEGSWLYQTMGQYNPNTNTWLSKPGLCSAAWPYDQADVFTLGVDCDSVTAGVQPCVIEWGGWGEVCTTAACTAMASCGLCCDDSAFGYEIDLEANTWTGLPVAPMTARIQLSGEWAGGPDEAVFWGGYRRLDYSCGFMCSGTYYVWRGDGASYDPVTDLWTGLTPLRQPPARREQTMVWTGSQMVVWGGCRGTSSSPCSTYLGDGARITIP